MSEVEMYEDLMRDIPPYPRLPKNGTREATELAIKRIDVKVEKLKNSGCDRTRSCWNTVKN